MGRTREAKAIVSGLEQRIKSAEIKKREITNYLRRKNHKNNNRQKDALC